MICYTPDNPEGEACIPARKLAYLFAPYFAQRSRYDIFRVHDDLSRLRRINALKKGFSYRWRRFHWLSFG